MSRHLAIVPALNEAGSIAQTVAEIRQHAAGFDVLVVDDGSTDETAAIAAAAGARVISLPFNVGIGGAMQCGYLYARDNGYEVAVQVDGDGQHDPRDIPRLLAALARASRPSRWSPGRASCADRAATAPRRCAASASASSPR